MDDVGEPVDRHAHIKAEIELLRKKIDIKYQIDVETVRIDGHDPEVLDQAQSTKFQRHVALDETNKQAVKKIMINEITVSKHREEREEPNDDDDGEVSSAYESQHDY